MTKQASVPTQVHAERADCVLTLSLDGPGTRNSIDITVYRAIQSLVISAGEDAEIRAIVLTGLNGFFSSGGNINSLRKSAQGTMAEVTAITDALNGMVLAIRACPKPVVAAVEGGAAGAGFSLALACDMIVAAAASRFVVAQVKVGLTPDGGMTHFLREGLPRQFVTEMCLTGDPVAAERLHALGIVNRVVPAGETIAEATKIARKLAAGATGAMAVIKAEIASHDDLASQLLIEARNMNRARFGAEAAEGLAAFLEKRNPDFPGKAGPGIPN